MAYGDGYSGGYAGGITAVASTGSLANRLNQVAGTTTVAQYAAALSLPGTTGNYASAPDSAAVSITGDIDIRAKVALDDWTPSAAMDIVAKWTTTGNQRAYAMRVDTGGEIGWRSSANGVTVPIDVVSSVGVSFANGTTGWVRATLDIDNGASGNDVKFYTSDDGVTWTQLGSTRTTAGTTAIVDSTAVLEIGSSTLGTVRILAGNVYYAEVRNGIGGTIVAKFDPTAVVKTAPRAPTTLVSTTGETWTMNGSAWSWVNGVFRDERLDAAGAANAWAGTTGLELVGALNSKNGTTGKELAGVLRDLGFTVEGP